MATQAQAATQDLPLDQQAVKKTSKKKLWFVLGLMMIVAVMGGAGLMLLIQPDVSGNEEAAAEVENVEPGPPPVFLTLEPFVVNLRGEDGDNYLRLGVVLQGTNDDAIEVAKQQLPRIRNGILLLLSSKSADDISTMEGKQRLMEEIITESRAPMTLNEPNKGIESVYFSDFVIQ